MSEHTPYKGEVVGAIPTWTTKFNGHVAEWETHSPQERTEQSVGVQIPPCLPFISLTIKLVGRQIICILSCVYHIYIHMNKLCEYGCGLIGKFQLKNGKYCCSSHNNSCTENKKKNAEGLKQSYENGTRKPAGYVYKNLSDDAKKKMAIKTTLSRVKSDIKKRDYEDTHRKISSLKPAKDAVLLDSSFYNTKAAFVEIDEVIRNEIKRLNATKHKSL